MRFLTSGGRSSNGEVAAFWMVLQTWLGCVSGYGFFNLHRCLRIARQVEHAISKLVDGRVVVEVVVCVATVFCVCF